MQLSMTPTPIHSWSPPRVPDGYEVAIKREDLAGSTLSGNKVLVYDYIHLCMYCDHCMLYCIFMAVRVSEFTYSCLVGEETGVSISRCSGERL